MHMQTRIKQIRHFYGLAWVTCSARSYSISISFYSGSMARLDDGDSSYESSPYTSRFQSRENLLTEYGILLTHSHSFRSLHDFKEICGDFYTDMVEGNTTEGGYLGFTHVRMSDIVDIDAIWSEIPKMRILYDCNEEILIMKFMVGVTHELCAGLLASEFDRLVQARTGINRSILPLVSARFRGFRRMKEADQAFKPSSRRLATDWPSVVFEVGVSEGLRQL